MKPTPRPVYQESQPMVWWARLLLWGAVLVGAGVASASTVAGAGAAAWPLLLVMPAVALVVQWAVGILFVAVDNDGVVARMGRTGLLRKRFTWDEIEGAEAVSYHPMKEFGGWGIRWGVKGERHKRAWTQRGNRAVVLHLADGTDFYLGSDDPRRLLERMRSAAAGRLDPSLPGERP